MEIDAENAKIQKPNNMNSGNDGEKYTLVQLFFFFKWVVLSHGLKIKNNIEYNWEISLPSLTYFIAHPQL